MRVRTVPPLFRLPLIAAGCAIVLSAGWAVLPGRTPVDATIHAQPANSARVGKAGAANALGEAAEGRFARNSPSSSVTRGTFVKTIRLNGLVEAVQATAVRAPQIAGAGGQQMIITTLIPKGTRVKKGDLVIEFDRQNQLRTAQDKRAEWLDLEQQIRKKRAEHLAQQAKDETELKAAENAVALAKLDVLKNEVLPRIEAEKNKLTLESSQAKYTQLKETFALKRKAAEAEGRILEVRRDRSALAMRQAESNAERMAIRAPIDGLVVYRSVWRGGQPGDPQEGLEVWSGFTILDVVGDSAMRVRVKVNQADVDLLRVGQQAAVELDAYPGRTYKARLDQLAPIGITGTFSPKVRTFTATFAVEGVDATLMPDLSAAIDVELERRDNVLLAPRDAVEFKENKAYLRVKNGSSAEARAVTIGGMNDFQVVITGGAEAGLAVDTVARAAAAGTRGGL